ncbi:rab effector Noc2 isoform X4 [Sapajus apella]|uniref:Rab effector Noc2 isoform X4 n=1 Tax=Sapajus apella TaxID=9515 RepID=A0A6J3GNC3_SAPAP|nr:rab effector Noc2 isoform X4 [Sapajus apella]
MEESPAGPVESHLGLEPGLGRTEATGGGSGAGGRPRDLEHYPLHTRGLGLFSAGATPHPPPGALSMADTIFGSGNDQWVCPNDRQLALRAKLHTGWSVHTYQTEKQRRDQHLSPTEVEAILQVIQRAERLDVLEQQRIGRLVERLETLRGNVMGNGLSQCLLCGEVLGFLGSSSVFCKDCRKVWKRSGAWFYKGLPKYILPLKTPGRADDPHLRPLPVELAERETRSFESSRVYTWARGRGVSSDSDSDSDLSSSSLEDRLPPTGVRDPKDDKPWRKSGGSDEAPRMGLARPPGHLSGSQSSLASETGTGSADPQGTLPRADLKGPGKRHTWAIPRC